MNIDIIKNLKKVISKEICLIDSQIQKRKRKLSCKDILYFLSYMYGNNTSYAITNTHMKTKKITNVVDSAISKFRDKIDYQQIANLNSVILNHMYDVIGHKNGRILAVDGSQLEFCKKLINDGFRSSTNGTYSVGYLSNLFDINNNLPIDYHFSKTHKNERKLLLEQLPSLRKNDTVIMDRGYFSNDLLKQLSEAKIKVIFRVNERLNIVKQLKQQKKDDIIISNYDNLNIDIRAITYTINNKKYYLLTNITDKTIDELKTMYWKRWNVETNFRHIKHDLSLNNNKSKKENNIQQSIAVHQLIISLNAYFEFFMKKELDKNNVKINTANNLYTIVNKIMYFLLYGKSTKKLLNTIYKIFSILKSVVTNIQKDRHYDRVWTKMHSNWSRKHSKSKPQSNNSSQQATINQVN